MHRYFAMSPAAAGLAAELFPEWLAGTRSIVVGFPKLDVLVHGTRERKATLQRLQLPAGRPMVLVCSHWSDGALLNRCGGMVAELRAAKDVSIVITAHDLNWRREELQFSKGVDRWSTLEQSVAGADHVRLVRASDSRPLMIAADVLIGDHSAITCEFAVLDRPILRFVHPAQDEVNGTLLRLKAGAMRAFYSAEGIREAVRAELRAPDRQSVERRALTSYLYAHLGSAAERTADACLVLARQAPAGHGGEDSAVTDGAIP